MRTRSILLTTVAVLPGALFANQAAGQSITLAPPPVRAPLDENGVNLSTGDIVAPSSTVAIGGDQGLVHSRYRVDNGWRHNYILSISTTFESQGGFTIEKREVNMGGSRVSFAVFNGNYTPLNGARGTLVEDTNGYTYTSGGSTVYRFEKAPVANGESYYEAVDAVGTSITTPSGAKTELTYRGDSYTHSGATIYVVRLQSVNNTAGYQLKFEYSANTPSSANADDWYEINKVTAVNNANEYCDPTADSCALTQDWPFLAYSMSASGTDKLETVTDVLGRQSRFRTDASDRLTGVKRPSETDDGMTIAYDTSSRVYSVTHQALYTRYYTWSTDTNGNLVSDSNDNLGRQRTVVTDPNEFVIVSDTNALGHTTSFTHDSQGRVTEVLLPEGNKVQYTRDDRGRVTEVRRIAKPSVGGSDIVTSATYPAITSSAAGWQCAVAVTCDKPLTTTDAKGNVTDYTYDPAHGGVLTVELPADQHGLRPRTIVDYTTATARFYTAPGTLADSDPVTVVQHVRRCRDLEYCPGQTREQLATIGYATGTAARNLQPTHTIASLGNNTLVSRSDYTYDHLGNVLSMDGPLAGSDDTTTYRYDDAGQLIGTITADPDGTGSQKHFATRLTYNLDGQVTTREQGRVDGLTQADWDAFAPDYKFITDYDDFGRVVKQAQVHPTAIHQYSATQYSYDLAGRVTCTAQRMNAPYSTTALPADACTLMAPPTGGDNDRISANYYDTADRLIETRNAVGTPLEQITASFTYYNNGTMKNVTDANGNLTLYELDGHDRSTTIYYPDASNPGQHNPNDKEVVAYDLNGNITQWTNRAGEQFTFTHDNLNRVITKVVPERTGLDPTHTRDVYYDYDLLGQLTEARFDSLTGEGLSFTYNSRGHLLTAETNMDGVTRQVKSVYDELNRRTRITYPDNRWFTYEYDVLNRFTKLYRYATAALVTQLYRPTGQQGVSATGGQALNTSTLYDAAGRNTTRKLTSGTSPYNVTNTFTYNPAYQVTSETPDNPLYEWDASINSQVTYTANGLNQYTQVAGNTYSYDGNGNLSGDGTTTYTYDPENRLISTSSSDPTASNNATLRYDPFGRLYEVTDDDTGDKRRLVYDGDALIAEYAPDGTMLDRYLHGPSGLDDPLVWYQDDSVSSTSEHYLHADRLGSIVAISKRDGSVTGVNSYDEYGMPGSNPIGRFRYTGQAWVPEAGLYYYKARMYSPSNGRFLQTDPIGYADGMNMYRYVGNDPVNGIDPTGTQGLSSCFEALRGFTIYVFDTSGDGKGQPTEPYSHTILRTAMVCPGDGTQYLQSLSSALAQHAEAVGSKKLKITIDKSCDGVTALQLPGIQARAARLLVLQNRFGREYAFFSGRGGALRLGVRYNGPIFSSPDTSDGKTIRARDVNANYFGPGLTHHAADLLLHSHPTRGVGGQPGDGDWQVARDLNVVVAAIEPSGRITCTTGQ